MARKYNVRTMTDTEINSRVWSLLQIQERWNRVERRTGRLFQSNRPGWTRYWDLSDAIRRYNRLACMPLSESVVF